MGASSEFSMSLTSSEFPLSVIQAYLQYLSRYVQKYPEVHIQKYQHLMDSKKSKCLFNSPFWRQNSKLCMRDWPKKATKMIFTEPDLFTIFL